MNLDDWSFYSCEDNTISLHDCFMSCVKCEKNGLWMIFEEGFNVTKDNSLNTSGRHQLTGKAAIFLKSGSYLEGAWNRNCTIQNSKNSKPIKLQETPILQKQFANWSLEILDFEWEPQNKHLSIIAIDEVGYCEINFFCEELWFCWNDFITDAWFQDWPKTVIQKD